MMWFGLPREREPAARGRSRSCSRSAATGEVVRSSFFWRMVLLSGAVQGGFIAMQTLWLGPWFTRVLHMTPQQSAGWLFVFNADPARCLPAGGLPRAAGRPSRKRDRPGGGGGGAAGRRAGSFHRGRAGSGRRLGLAGHRRAVTTVFSPIQASVGMSLSRAPGRARPHRLQPGAVHRRLHRAGRARRRDGPAGRGRHGAAGCVPRRPGGYRRGAGSPPGCSSSAGRRRPCSVSSAVREPANTLTPSTTPTISSPTPASVTASGQAPRSSQA